ncbi:hypothetical protein TIFTF001_026048 [Ficus carica]|uniref:Uncharacterized protein n=1 Tax=Ficus carica TaxID=3494 RepID=A0AA88B1S1_FICCA|nr:hypothetical protein TIFTF001_026048 [Ficus carica]
MANSITENSVQIRDVWNDNLEEEFAMIRSIVDGFNHVAMDTEFPGYIYKFGELLMSSGIVMKDCLRDVDWVVFHGWFDFGYLLKLLT